MLGFLKKLFGRKEDPRKSLIPSHGIKVGDVLRKEDDGTLSVWKGKTDYYALVYKINDKWMLRTKDDEMKGLVVFIDNYSTFGGAVEKVRIRNVLPNAVFGYLE